MKYKRAPLPPTVQLDGTKSKEQLFNFVFGNILNEIQKCL